ncbi:hypothetical protein QBC32DRAFT_22850 [Pseudoneurospora amorphoporcata]|uniref:Apple domain-containing protein n=1 Tax=Pseudoneurospora amorphoporcata TaxID=241081 RepID=A0AAN6P2Y5_9PEZI|nr:hypothetical protein QBC32DRAFT_22850 [Pseudoneurospora amorphoporcata]
MDPSHLLGSSASQARNQTRGVRFTEERPTHHIYQPQPRRSSPRTSPTHGKAPEVYWADDDGEDERKNDAKDNTEDSQYTFFREGTPTPPEYNDEHEKGLAAERAAGGGTVAGSYAASRSTVGSSLPPTEESRGCIGRHQQRWGLRRGVLWAIIIAVILLVIVLPLSVGLGVGLSRSSKSTATDPNPSSSQTVLPISSSPEPFPSSSAVPNHIQTSVSSATTTPTSTTSSSNSKPRPTAYSDCPAANNTMHRIPGLAKSFLRLCGVDYTADDLGNFLAGNMAECIDACAAMERCTGCSWGYLDGDKGNKHRCWLKGNLGTAREQPGDWCFAMIPR